MRQLLAAAIALGVVLGVAAGCGGGDTAAPGSTTGAATAQAPAQEGDATRGKAVFASSGCGSCHTLAAAGAEGTVGPNLDDARPSFTLALTRVTNGKGVMPSFKGTLSAEQIRDVAAFVSQRAGS